MMKAPRNRDGGGGDRGRHRHRTVVFFAIAAIALEAVVMRLRGYRIGANVIVRCRPGHLFTTIWIPGASVKALRFGQRRFQYCPVGHHWSFVTPVREADLSEEEIRLAHQHRDIPIP